LVTQTHQELLKNRVKFKFYAVEQHLNNLKNLENNGETLDKPSSRVNWEIEIENLLFHLVGVIDAILGRINEKLILGLDSKDITVCAVKSKLSGSKNSDLLNELNDLLNRNLHPNGNSLLRLKETRNSGTHRKIINVKSAVNLHENVNTGVSHSDKTHFYFKADPDSTLEISIYLQKTL
jgi:hypothetical protein